MKAVAQTILSAVRKSDTAIRYGGDEIYVVFHEMQKEHLERRLQAIREKVLAIEILNAPDLKISISIGGYCRGNELSDPIDIVDQKMYQAKKENSHIVI